MKKTLLKFNFQKFFFFNSLICLRLNNYLQGVIYHHDFSERLVVNSPVWIYLWLEIYFKNIFISLINSFRLWLKLEFQICDWNFVDFDFNLRMLFSRSISLCKKSLLGGLKLAYLILNAVLKAVLLKSFRVGFNHILSLDHC